MPGRKRLAGALVAVAAAMAISACGSSSSDSTIPTDDANALLSRLNGVQSAIDNERCQLAEQRAGEFLSDVNLLPDSVTPEDKEKLRKAGENLTELANDPSQCKPAPTTGASGETGVEPTTPTTTASTTATSTTTTQSSTTDQEPPENGGGDEGGGGPPTDTGGGPPSGGGGGQTGGGGVGGGSGGSGGTGTGGTGGGGTG